MVESSLQQAKAPRPFEGGLNDASVARVNEIDKLIEGSFWASLDIDTPETIDVLVEYHARIRQDLLEFIGTSGHRTLSLQPYLDFIEVNRVQVHSGGIKLDHRIPYAPIGFDVIQTHPFDAATWLFLGVEKDLECSIRHCV